MPWTSRPSRRSGAHLRHDLRRWRYDHSEDLRAFCIGAAVVVATLAGILAMKLLA